MALGALFAEAPYYESEVANSAQSSLRDAATPAAQRQPIQHSAGAPTTFETLALLCAGV